MATNLVSIVMQFLTPDMIGKIAAALGLDREDAQSGVAAAVPTLLAAITGAAAKPGGAQNLVDAIKQQSGVLDSFAGMIGGGKQPAFIEKGSSLLNSLLGSQDQSALTTAIGKSAGLGQDGTRSLLGMLTPVVMGLIGKQIGSRLDVGSLTSLLSSQKQQIAQALPAGMNNLLGGTGLLDSLISATGSATDAAGQMGRAASAATGDAARYASSTVRSVGATGQRAASSTASGMPNWVYWAVPLALIAGLGLYFLGNRGTQVAQQAPATVQSVVVGGVDIGKQVGDSLTTLRTSLQGITDVPSATAALPKLQEATAQIDRANGMLGQMSEDQQKLVSGMVASSMTTIDQLFDKVLAIPGVGDVLKPTVDSLRTRIAVLSGQNTTVGVKR
jgi:Bacterial protein of unknown function (DUF937)